MILHPEPLTAAAALRRGVTQLSRRMWSEERPEHGRTGTQLAVMSQLYRNGPMTPGALASAERLQPQSLTRTLASLEASHLVAREPDPNDGRRSVIGLTTTGFVALRDDMALRDRWIAAAMTTQLTTAERGLLGLAGELMERLASGTESSSSVSATDGIERHPSYRGGVTCHIELPATDVTVSSQFYNKTFGWRIQVRGDGHTAFDDAARSLSGVWVENSTASGPSAIRVHFGVSDLDRSIGAIQANGGKVLDRTSAPEATARFEDPAGNVLGVFVDPNLPI